MKSDWLRKSPLGRFACFVVDLILLNILFIVTSLPIFTMGTSTTALYYTASQRQRGEESMTQTFFTSFKKNFVYSLIIWLITLVVGLILYINFTIIDALPIYREIGLAILAVPCFLYFCIVAYLFPLLAEFETGFLRLFSNAALMSIAHFPRTILMVLVNALPLITIFLSPSWLAGMVFIWCPCIFSLCAVINTRILAPVFEPYRPEEPDLSDVW